MRVDSGKYCNTHSKEKENSGECCQLDEQKEAEQATYEYYPKIHELAKAKPNKIYSELEKELNE